MRTVIHWFRRDLRLHDNAALSAAVCAAKNVAPVFIMSDWKAHHRWTGAPRQAFLCGSLEVLARNLRAAGGGLIVRRGDAPEQLEKLAREVKADAIFFNRDPDPFGREMEKKLEALGKTLGCEICGFKDVAIRERDEVMTVGGTPFRVFSAYARAWLKQAEPESSGPVKRIRTPAGIRSRTLPTLQDWALQLEAETVEAGEDAARERLSHFLRGAIFDYAEKRDLPADQATSRLSADLRFGTLSPREVYLRCKKALRDASAVQRQSVTVFINELIWREFYMNVLWHWPGVLETDFNPKFRAMKWRTSEPDFKKWCDGETGFPIVDAAMRQLRATGFMHNRLRMVVAMFLTKDLQLHWKLGEQFFLQHLADGEIASNNGGWQWSAGTGADAAPYFRVQNPWRQTKRFDPRGDFIQRWLPELREVAAAKFMHPPRDGEKLARNYPPPMVDHSRARAAAIEMFRSCR